MHRHRFHVSAPVIPNASGTFCTKNTDFVLLVGGWSFSVGSTLIKCHFFNPHFAAGGCPQVTELKGNGFEVQEDIAQPLGTQG